MNRIWSAAAVLGLFIGLLFVFVGLFRNMIDEEMKKEKLISANAESPVSEQAVNDAPTHSLFLLSDTMLYRKARKGNDFVDVEGFGYVSWQSAAKSGAVEAIIPPADSVNYTIASVCFTRKVKCGRLVKRLQGQ